jgi:hypothetical protein
MTLTEEKIESNAKTYFKTGEKYGFINDAFIENYGEAMMEAPYSKTEEGHNCFNGGLIDHIIKMTKHALAINENLSEDKVVEKETLIKVCFLHQIGKANMFTPNDSKWHLDRGINYEFNDETVALPVGSKSLEIANECGIELSTSEHQAIALYGSEFGNRDFNHDSVRIGAIIKAANLLTIIDEK